ncbi:MAG: hypothetical protein AB1752_11290 [Candidatus Zixiibacteriota bacterium]
MPEHPRWRVLLTINGAPVPLNTFAESIIGNTIDGMVGALKLESAPEQIVIELAGPVEPQARVGRGGSKRLRAKSEPK